MQFEWTTSGLECLRKIQNEINNHGGIEKYTQMVINEQDGNHIKVDRFADKQSLEILLSHGLNVTEISMVLKKDYRKTLELLKYYNLK